MWIASTETLTVCRSCEGICLGMQNELCLIHVLDGAMHDAVPAIAALGVSPIVRIPDMQGWMVKRKPTYSPFMSYIQV